MASVAICAALRLEERKTARTGAPTSYERHQTATCKSKEDDPVHVASRHQEERDVKRNRLSTSCGNQHTTQPSHAQEAGSSSTAIFRLQHAHLSNQQHEHEQ
jgi:hypothetical protein